MFRGIRSDWSGRSAEGGVKFLHIGVNSASTPPDVPDLFVWKDRTGATLTVMYQHKGYGGVVRIPGSDLADRDRDGRRQRGSALAWRRFARFMRICARSFRAPESRRRI